MRTAPPRCYRSSAPDAHPLNSKVHRPSHEVIVVHDQDVRHRPVTSSVADQHCQGRAIVPTMAFRAARLRGRGSHRTYGSAGWGGSAPRWWAEPLFTATRRAEAGRVATPACGDQASSMTVLPERRQEVGPGDHLNARVAENRRQRRWRGPEFHRSRETLNADRRANHLGLDGSKLRVEVRQPSGPGKALADNRKGGSGRSRAA